MDFTATSQVSIKKTLHFSTLYKMALPVFGFFKLYFCFFISLWDMLGERSTHTQPSVHSSGFTWSQACVVDTTPGLVPHSSPWRTHSRPLPCHCCAQYDTLWGSDTLASDSLLILLWPMSSKQSITIEAFTMFLWGAGASGLLGRHSVQREWG